ncbi:MAG: type 1 glutamine amidotransferase domain-containing protein [Bacteriovorax sp.]
MKKVIIPIPGLDFDPTEVALSWKILKQRGIAVEFATPDGLPGEADSLMLTGRGLDPWGWVPFLKCFPLLGIIFRARKDARKAYLEMTKDEAFRRPHTWANVSHKNFDGILLPGGHRARGMKTYLESQTLQKLVSSFFRENLPVAAVCHGVLLVARSINPENGRSVLYGRKTTALTWKLENSAATVARFSRFWDPHYYRTYVESKNQQKGHMGVQQEVTRALEKAEDFMDVESGHKDHWLKTSGLFRDSEKNRRPSWVVRDGNYISARWPGDLYAFAHAFADLVLE